VTYTDTNPVSGQPYVYSITKTLSSGTDLLESVVSERELTILFDAVIISSTTDGLNYRAALSYQTSAKVSHNDERAVFMPWGDAEPYIQLGNVDYDTVVSTFRIITDRRGNAKDTIANLRELKERQTANMDTLVYRDGRGRRVFGLMPLSEGDERLGVYTVDVGFTETAFKEGEIV
jgi:hypothetical protein